MARGREASVEFDGASMPMATDTARRRRQLVSYAAVFVIVELSMREAGQIDRHGLPIRGCLLTQISRTGESPPAGSPHISDDPAARSCLSVP